MTQVARSVESGRRAPARRFVPCLPTLGPALLAPRLRAPCTPFPLSGVEVRRYYFARNGVWLAARLLGLRDHEVLVPAYHHGVEVEALRAAGAVPRFVRVDRRMQLDLDHLQAGIGPRTRALYVIHYLGFPQPMDDILAVARRHGLAVVEDCALALLSRDGDVPLGSRGDLAIFCLYKSLPVPNGGLLVLNRAFDAPYPARRAPVASTLSHLAGSVLAHVALRSGWRGEAMREAIRRGGRALRAALRLQVLSTGTSHFDMETVDVGISPLTRLIADHLDHAAIVEARRRNWFLLFSRLREVAPPVHLELPPGVCPLFYPLVCSDKETTARHLAARGVETVDFWSQGDPACPRGAFPEVDALRSGVLEIPLHQDLGDEDMEYLASAIVEALS